MGKLVTFPTALQFETTCPELPAITPEARRYAVKELARRACVSREFFQKWTIEVTANRTTISFGPEVHGQIHFPHRVGPLRRGVPVARANSLNGAHQIPAPDIVLPFCEADTESTGPLFRPTSLGSLTCRHDVLSSLLFTLSRLEETLPATLDEHSRFPASASVACIHDFLERPIVDEHGLAFGQAISTLIPRWQAEPPVLYLKLTHDIDDVGIPFTFRSAVAHTVKRRRPAATCRDLLSYASSVEPTELSQVRKLAHISRSRNLHSAFYWKASLPGPRDSGYHPKNGKIQRTIRFLKESGYELGVHPGYETFGDRSKLAAEVNCLREALGVELGGGRQHYLRWSPATWSDWESCGLAYDSSVGFAERFGFRAGTAFPYRPWCFTSNRELNLVEIPLILMDCTPVKYMRLERQAALQRIQALIQRMKHTGGVFTLLWHNTPLLDPEYKGWYESVLDMLADAIPYQLPPSPQRLW